MARYRLRKPEQPFLLRLVLGLYEFAASLKLAVILIFALAAVLATSTLVESEYGTPAVQFALYGSWWFEVLGVLLAVNIFAAAAIRYPWKRHQTGFVITHIGLLTLMFGCLLNRVGGIDSQMPIFEDCTNSKAFLDTERLKMEIRNTSQTAPPPTSSTSDEITGATASAPGETSGSDDKSQVIAMPFQGSPFNWGDLDKMRAWPSLTGRGVTGALASLGTLPMRAIWRAAPIDRGVLYDQDGIRVEALDYYSNAQEIQVPRLRLRMSMPESSVMGPDGREQKARTTWTTVADSSGDELVINSPSNVAAAEYPFGMGDRKSIGGGQVIFTMTGDPAELAAFLESAPDADLGVDAPGQLVLFAKGEKFPIKVADHVDKGEFPLGETGVTVEIVKRFERATIARGAQPGQLGWVEAPEGAPSRPALELRVRHGGADPERMLLVADWSELNVQARRLHVFGSYWVASEVEGAGNGAAAPAMGQGKQRIDVLQGPDQKLYYRYWNRREVVAAGELPEDGTPIDAFTMRIGTLKLKTDRHLAAETPRRIVEPVAFDKMLEPTRAIRAARLRVTVDGHTEEFWLLGMPPGTGMFGPHPSERKVVAGRDRSVALSLPLDEFDVGLTIRLRDFERKLDPGTSQASHYTSVVDFLNEKTLEPMQQNVVVTMNAPVDFTDPAGGKSYRLFQESFSGPYLPGEDLYSQYERLRDPRLNSTERDKVYVSVLTVNYSPGRGLVNAGCLLVVAGIVTMFYMRAYFFKPKPKAVVVAATQQKARQRPLAPV
ncbi:MAG: hypothetical protein AB7U73_07030 [Pirellulales bacterium]